MSAKRASAEVVIAKRASAAGVIAKRASAAVMIAERASAAVMTPAAWRGLGLLLLAVGTVLSTLGAARMTDDGGGGWRSAPMWSLFALGTACLCGAGLLLRMHAAAAAEGPQGRGTGELARQIGTAVRALQGGQPAVLGRSSASSVPPALDLLTTTAAPDDEAGYGLWLKLQLDPILEQLYPEVMATRDRFRRDHGLQAFAGLFSELAHAERLLCRAWSAAVDGYTQEARSALALATQPLARAEQLLEDLSAAGTPEAAPSDKAASASAPSL